MMVEKLLETFIGVVDAKLLEGVEVENFKTGDIENTNEEVLWQISCKSTIDYSNKPIE